MSDQEDLTEENWTSGRLLLPSLSLSYFATWPPVILVGLLLIEIGQTFDRSIGVVGQLLTMASLVTAISAVFMSVWSIRYNHKSLLLMGLALINLSALGCAFALNFPMLLLFFSLSGLGLAMVEPMLFTLVGAHFTLEQRAPAIGWLFTGIALSLPIGAPVIGVIAGLGRRFIEPWRLAFLGFVLPTALLSFVMTAKTVPSSRSKQNIPKNQKKSWKGFKDVFTNRSALMCLVSSLFGMTTYQAIEFYGSSFFRNRFRVSIGFASILIVGVGIFYILGSIISGQMVNWFGRRPLTVVTAFIAGIFTIFYMNVRYFFWLAVALRFLASLFLGMMFTATSSLTLEQIPNNRGTMMALNSAAWYLGMALGAGIGGLAMIWFDYEVLGLVLGAPCLVASLLYFFFVRDPTSEHSLMGDL